MSLYENPIASLDDSEPKANNLPKVAYVGVCFTSLFTAYIASQNLAAHIYTDLGFDGLGTACVLNIYTFLATGSIFASHVKRSLSHKAGFMIGASCYALFVLAGLFTAYCGEYELTTGLCSHNAVYGINLVATVFVGLGASIIWLTQSDYVNQCADESTKGLYNGVFWSLMQMSQIIGSVLSTILMKVTTIFNLYLVLFCFGLISVVMFAFTPKVTSSTPISEDAQELEPLSKSVKKFFKALTNGRYVYMMMGMVTIGIAIAYYANFLSKIAESIYMNNNAAPVEADYPTKGAFEDAVTQYNSEKNGNVGYALVALAIGEVLAGVVVGRLGDAMKKVHVLHICVLVAEIGLGLSFLAYKLNIAVIALAAGFFWGFCDTGLNTIIGSIIGSSYDGALELFSLMRFLTGTGAAFGSCLALIIGDSNVITYSCIIVVIIGTMHLVLTLASKGLNLGNNTPKHSLLTAADELYN